MNLRERFGFRLGVLLERARMVLEWLGVVEPAYLGRHRSVGGGVPWLTELLNREVSLPDGLVERLQAGPGTVTVSGVNVTDVSVCGPVEHDDLVVLGDLLAEDTRATVLPDGVDTHWVFLRDRGRLTAVQAQQLALQAGGL